VGSEIAEVKRRLDQLPGAPEVTAIAKNLTSMATAELQQTLSEINLRLKIVSEVEIQLTGLSEKLSRIEGIVLALARLCHSLDTAHRTEADTMSLVVSNIAKKDIETTRATVRGFVLDPTGKRPPPRPHHHQHRSSPTQTK